MSNLISRTRMCALVLATFVGACAKSLVAPGGEPVVVTHPEAGTLPPGPSPFESHGGACRTSVTASWAAVTDAKYEVQWGLGDKFATTVEVAAGTTSTTFTNLRPGTYEWRVRSIESGVTSDWSMPTSFAIAPGNLPATFSQSSENDFGANINTTVYILATGVALAGTLDTGDASEGPFTATTNQTITGGVHSFSSFVIAAGTTVTVTGPNPLILKVKRDVDIAGTLDASGPNGGNGVTFSTFGSGGIAVAGGSNGGDGSYVGSATAGHAGAGLGQGAMGTNWQGGGGAGYAFAGMNSAVTTFGTGALGGVAYGSADLTSLVGGSGGGGGSGGNSCGSGGGGAGGGVIQIGAGSSIVVGPNGAIFSNGGNGGTDAGGLCGGGGAGSGGAIWLASPVVANEGRISGMGGIGGTSGVGTAGGGGSVGRVRVDGTMSGAGIFTPVVGYISPYAHSPSGTTVTPPIAPLNFCSWGRVSFSALTPPGTTVLVDVLDRNGTVLAAGVASDTDLSALDVIANTPSIALRATLTTNDVATTPTLTEWNVAYAAK